MVIRQMSNVMSHADLMPEQLHTYYIIQTDTGRICSVRNYRRKCRLQTIVFTVEFHNR